MFDEETLKRLYGEEDEPKAVLPLDSTPPPPTAEKEPPASQRRFRNRLERFYQGGVRLPGLQHHGLWLLHNCVAHPILAFSPGSRAVEFHELTSHWLNFKDVPLGGSGVYARTLIAHLPSVEKRWRWFVHNALVHPLIGILPVRWAFDLHDRSAEKMEVPGWV